MHVTTINKKQRHVLERGQGAGCMRWFGGRKQGGNDVIVL